MANPAKSYIPYTHSQTNEVRWKEVDASVNCASRPIVTASEWANLLTTQPGVITGYNFKRKLVCVVSVGDIVVTSDPNDFTPEGTTPVTPDPGATNPSDEANVINYTSTSTDDGGTV